MAVGGTGVAVGGFAVGVAAGSGVAPPHPASNQATSMMSISWRSLFVFTLVSFPSFK